MAAAIAAVWLPGFPPVRGRHIPPWVGLFCVALIVGTCLGVVNTAGWACIGLFLALIARAAAPQTAGLRLARILDVAVIVMLFGFGNQLLPGFVSTTVVSPLRVSPDAAPMRVIGNFDVELAALFLLALYGKRVTRLKELRAIAVPTLAVATATVTAVIGMAVALGYVRFDLKWPPFALVHLGKTLLVTAVVEEAFFRGVIQERLTHLSVFRASRVRRAIPVAISALVFGLAHLRGGWLLALLATLAGLGYAFAYSLTERIEAPIAVHFIVNATHFVAFTDLAVVTS
jgi:membrane protease YdiL (CAAX protease family)